MKFKDIAFKTCMFYIACDAPHKLVILCLAMAYIKNTQKLSLYNFLQGLLSHFLFDPAALKKDAKCFYVNSCILVTMWLPSKVFFSVLNKSAEQDKLFLLYIHVVECNKNVDNFMHCISLLFIRITMALIFSRLNSFFTKSMMLNIQKYKM